MTLCLWLTSPSIMPSKFHPRPCKWQAFIFFWLSNTPLYERERERAGERQSVFVRVCMCVHECAPV